MNPVLAGLDIYTVKGWDYAALCDTFKAGIQKIRDTHIPAVFHVQEITQPQGHSTSGSHERYKSKERLEWEKEMDCIKKMKEFILENAIAKEEDLLKIEEEARQLVLDSKKASWEKFITPIKQQVQEATTLCNQVVFEGNAHAETIATHVKELNSIKETTPTRCHEVAGTGFFIWQENQKPLRRLETFISIYRQTPMKSIAPYCILFLISV